MVWEGCKWNKGWHCCPRLGMNRKGMCWTWRRLRWSWMRLRWWRSAGLRKGWECSLWRGMCLMCGQGLEKWVSMCLCLRMWYCMIKKWILMVEWRSIRFRNRLTSHSMLCLIFQNMSRIWGNDEVGCVLICL